MKIVGNHPGDYYDIGLSAGVDEEILYVRNKPRFVETPECLVSETEFWPYYKVVAVNLEGNAYLEVQPITIGFAGKVYVLLSCSKHQSFSRINENPGTFTRLAHHSDLLTPYDGDIHYRKNRPNVLDIRLFKSYQDLKQHTGIDFQKHLPALVRQHKVLCSDPVINFKPFDEIGAPIFISGRIPAKSKNRWERYKQGFWTNPVLKDFGFQSIIEPWAAFQELSMFMASWARPQDVLQITDDIVLRNAKGFNEMSFKTISPGKKRKRKK